MGDVSEILYAREVQTAGDGFLASIDGPARAVYCVTDIAWPCEVLLSSTLKDLVAGSGLGSEDAGEHELKGVPDRWRLFRVVA